MKRYQSYFAFFDRLELIQPFKAFSIFQTCFVRVSLSVQHVKMHFAALIKKMWWKKGRFCLLAAWLGLSSTNWTYFFSNLALRGDNVDLFEELALMSSVHMVRVRVLPAHILASLPVDDPFSDNVTAVRVTFLHPEAAFGRQGLQPKSWKKATPDIVTPVAPEKHSTTFISCRLNEVRVTFSLLLKLTAIPKTRP